jgi:hypothetical protein
MQGSVILPFLGAPFARCAVFFYRTIKPIRTAELCPRTGAGGQ